jgi:DNA-binding LytR/AlgR family response regulator
MSYSVIIIDDEPLAHSVLHNYLKRVPGVDLQADFFNAPDAHSYLSKNKADIILLDIKMPEQTGLEFLRSLKTKPITILITAYRDFAFEGFELGVIDYLLKPIQFSRFEIAIKRAMEFLRLSKAADSFDQHDTSSKTDYELLIKNGTKKILLDYRKIMYAQGLKDYTILQTDDRKYVVKGSVKTFEEFLPNDFFIRVHKSFIVARNRIKVVHKNRIEMENFYIPVGRFFKADLDEYLNSKKSSNP